MTVCVITRCFWCVIRIVLCFKKKLFSFCVCCVADEEEVGPWTRSSAVSFRQKALSEVRTRKSSAAESDVGYGKAAIRADLGPYSDAQESELAVLSGWAGSGSLSSCHRSHRLTFSQISEEAHDCLHLPCSVGTG